MRICKLSFKSLLANISEKIIFTKPFLFCGNWHQAGQCRIFLAGNPSVRQLPCTLLALQHVHKIYYSKDSQQWQLQRLAMLEWQLVALKRMPRPTRGLCWNRLPTWRRKLRRQKVCKLFVVRVTLCRGKHCLKKGNATSDHLVVVGCLSSLLWWRWWMMRVWLCW